MDDATMLSIKEFSDFTGLHESTLRYYDKIGLLSPFFRGENRYRYYMPSQIITVHFIKVLTQLGVPLSTIKEMGGGRTPQRVLALLTQQERKLNKQLLELQTAYSIIHTYRNNIQAGISTHEHDIYVRELDEAPVILGPVTEFIGNESFYRQFMNFCNLARENKINVRYPIGGYYEDIDAFLNAPSQPTRFFSLDSAGDGRRKAGQYLVAHHKGYYGEFGELPQKLLSYTQANNLVFCGPLFITYLLDEVCIVERSQYLSQIVAEVSKKQSKAEPARSSSAWVRRPGP